MFHSSNDDEIEARRFTRRALLLGLGQAAMFGAIGARLYQLQVLDQRRYALLAEENRISVQLLAPARGRILDRDGEVLADNANTYRVTLVPSLVSDRRLIPQMLETVARVVPLSPEERDRLAVRARRSSPMVPVLIASDLTFEQVAALNLLAPQLPGIQTDVSGKRLYYGARTMGHIIGHVGALERFALDDDPVLRVPGMRTGRTGVERGLDERLRGVGGLVRHEVDARGRIVRTLERTEPQPGEDVRLTIASTLQAKVLDRLQTEKRGAVVALDLERGEVMALASVPTFDPTTLQNGKAQASSLRGRRLPGAINDPQVNRAIRGLYPPGSTFKMVTALAALEAKATTLREKIDCDGHYEYADQVFRCWRRSGHGSCDLHRALRESCDCYFYEMARRVGIEAISAMGRKLGLGQVHSVGIALQKSGLMPTPGWKLGRFNRPWLGGETIIAGIGQGYVLTTPLQLALMTGRIATGRAIVPTLVKAADRPNAFAVLDINPAHLEAVRKGMIAVVHEDGGTGSNARLDDESIRIGGKTGTSQVTRRSADTPKGDLAETDRDHALFVAYLPADKPRYAVAAVVEHGGGGGAIAAPLVRDVIELLLADQSADRPSRKGAAGPDTGSVRRQGRG